MYNPDKTKSEFLDEEKHLSQIFFDDQNSAESFIGGLGDTPDGIIKPAGGTAGTLGWVIKEGKRGKKILNFFNALAIPYTLTNIYRDCISGKGSNCLNTISESLVPPYAVYNDLVKQKEESEIRDNAYGFITTIPVWYTNPEKCSDSLRCSEYIKNMDDTTN
jgi:hypothetical protein